MVLRIYTIISLSTMLLFCDAGENIQDDFRLKNVEFKVNTEDGQNSNTKSLSVLKERVFKRKFDYLQLPTFHWEYLRAKLSYMSAQC
jgi:hypothetical protein